MKGKTKRIVAVVLCMALFLAVAPVSVEKASAAGTVAKVTMKSQQVDGGKARFLIQGKTSSGTVVWTYKTSAKEQTELDSASMKVKGNFVYVVDTNKYIRLKKSNGKVVAKGKLKTQVWGAAMAVDSDGNLYTIGYYGSTLYKVNSKGKTVWKHTFSDKFIWPYKITIKGDKVTVTFDQGGKKTVTVPEE